MKIEGVLVTFAISVEHVAIYRLPHHLAGKVQWWFGVRCRYNVFQ